MKLKKSYETETFLNEEGYFCISQEAWPDDSDVIALTPTQMRLLIQDMEKHLTNTDWFSEGTTEG